MEEHVGDGLEDVEVSSQNEVQSEKVGKFNAHLAEDELKQIARHVGEQEATGDGRNVQHDFSNFARDSVVEDALYVLFCECSLMSVGCPVQFLFLVFP